MTKHQRDAFVATLRGWRKTLAAQAAAYLADPQSRGVDYSQWTAADCARAVQSEFPSLAPACLCHETYLIEVLTQMLPTWEERQTFVSTEELWLAHAPYQLAYEITPTVVRAMVLNLPGCVTEAPTLVEARQRLIEAIPAHRATLPA